MKRKKIALFMAVAMTITSLPVGSITGYAEEGEDIILSDELPENTGGGITKQVGSRWMV